MMSDDLDFIERELKERREQERKVRERYPELLTISSEAQFLDFLKQNTDLNLKAELKGFSMAGVKVHVEAPLKILSLSYCMIESCEFYFENITHYALEMDISKGPGAINRCLFRYPDPSPFSRWVEFKKDGGNMIHRKKGSSGCGVPIFEPYMDEISTTKVSRYWYNPATGEVELKKERLVDND